MHVRGRGAGAIETEVPSSITQFDASTIEALGAQDISDLSRVTPNVNIVQPGATQATFFVRGVGLSDFSSNAAGAVTIFQDDVAINAPAIQTGQLFDVEGVDIVRGPQGTGPFRNASAGAIRVRSRRPTGNYSAQLRSSSAATTRKGDKGARDALIQDYEGALEMPIVEDALSSRFAFRLREAEPYRTNGCGNALPFEQRMPRNRGSSASTPLSDAAERRRCAESAEQSHVTRRVRRHLADSVRSPDVGGRRAQLGRARDAALPAARHASCEFFLNGHGSRLDQDSTLGQAIGTNAAAGARRTRRSASAATDRRSATSTPTCSEEFDELCGDDPSAADRVRRTATRRRRSRRGSPSGARSTSGPTAATTTASARRTRDTWGAFVSGEGDRLGDIEALRARARTTRTSASTDQDTDFTPDVLFEIVQERRGVADATTSCGSTASSRRSRSQWELGGYYLREDSTTTASTCCSAGATSRASQRIYSQDIDSFGAGRVHLGLPRRLHARGRRAIQLGAEGVRLPSDRPSRRWQPVARRRPTRAQDETWQTPTGQLILTYHFDAGQPRPTRSTRAASRPATSTRSRPSNLERAARRRGVQRRLGGGLRGAGSTGRLSLARSFFYYRYEDYQVFLFSTAPTRRRRRCSRSSTRSRPRTTASRSRARSRRCAAGRRALIEGLRLSGNFGWLHGEYLDFQTAQRSCRASGTRRSRSRSTSRATSSRTRRSTRSSGTAEWTFDLGRFGYLIPRYDINWTDDVFFDPNEGRGSIDADSAAPALPEYAIGQKPYFLHNVRLAYRTPTGNVEIAGWVRNIEDQVYKNYAFDASRFTSVVINFLGEPRTIGMRPRSITF